jgi:hypothetical protein
VPHAVWLSCDLVGLQDEVRVCLAQHLGIVSKDGWITYCGCTMGHDLWLGIVQANQMNIKHAGKAAQIGGIVERMPVAHANGGYTNAQAAPVSRRTLDRPVILPGYRTGENSAGIRILFSWWTGRTPVCGGHAPALRASSRIRDRSRRFL